MNRVVDNLLLLLLGMCILLGREEAAWSVTALLVAVITAAISVYLTDGKWMAVLTAAFALTGLFLPPLWAFLPIVCYHAVSWKMPIMACAAFFFLPELFSGRYQAGMLFQWGVLMAVAVILALRTGRMEKQQQEIIRIRDSSTERNLALQEKNRSLRKKQDYEIYLATLKERNRIAREIHDNVGHMLSRSILQMGALNTIYKEEPLCGQLSAVNNTLNQAMNSIRESVHDLHDDSVDLRQAVREAVTPMEERYTVRLDYDMSGSVPRNVKYCFIAAVKEGMSNVIKHSDADRIEIVLREHPGFFQLFIGDNGTGRGRNYSDGIGLSNMRERVEMLGGTIRISDQNGFSIMITLKRT